jgi:hypothetical protein
MGPLEPLAFFVFENPACAYHCDEKQENKFAGAAEPMKNKQTDCN